jgi:hypothetical protein
MRSGWYMKGGYIGASLTWCSNVHRVGNARIYSTETSGMSGTNPFALQTEARTPTTIFSRFADPDGFSSIYADVHDFNEVFVDFHGLSLIFKDFHEFS